MDAHRTFRTNLADAISASTKTAVAEAAGISRSHLDGILSGQINPTIATAESIATACGKTLAEMLGENRAIPA